MKKIHYQFWEEIKKGTYLHYNTFSNHFLLLNREKHELFEAPVTEIERRMPSFYQLLVDNQFLVDYYIMPKGCVCFAEKNRMTLFNYDGKIFKCSPLPSFDDEHALGTLEPETELMNANGIKL